MLEMHSKRLKFQTFSRGHAPGPLVTCTCGTTFFHLKPYWKPCLTFSCVLPENIHIYYINTNEIPGELSHENLISSHVKITCYLHMWKYHLCYGYITNCAFHTKKPLKWNGLVFHWCSYNKKNITWPLGDTKFLFSCWWNISLIRCTHSWNIFQHSKRNFVSLCGHVISSMPFMEGFSILSSLPPGHFSFAPILSFHPPCWNFQWRLHRPGMDFCGTTPSF